MKQLLASVLFLGLTTSVLAGSITTSEKLKCTPQNSFIEVLFGACKLEKGKNLYGSQEDLASLSSLSSSLSTVSGVGASNGH